MVIFGTIVACQPKLKNGFKLTVIDDFGLQQSIHTFYDYTYCCDFKSVWKIEVDKHDGLNNGFAFHFLTLAGIPRQVDSLDNSFRDKTPEYIANPINTSGIYQGIQRYQANPKHKQNLDKTFVWNRRNKVLEDVNSIHAGSNTSWKPTFKNGGLENEEESRKEFLENLKNAEKRYGNRVNYYRKPLTNSLDESTATLRLQKELHDDITVNNFPSTGTKYFVDSIAAQIAIREGHVTEFFAYFALITYLKKAKKYPTTNIQTALTFLSDFLNTYRKKHVKEILMGCAKAGFIKIEENDSLRILSQQEYVRKNEAAYNARARNGFKQYGLGISKVGRKPGVDAYIRYKELPKHKTQILPIINHQELYKTFRPYFTFYAYRSAELDTGFIHLLNAQVSQMRAFLYELVITSYAETPICRTMIATNLKIPKSTQLLYEKANIYLEKRTNHTEIPDDMFNTLNQDTKDKILKAVQIGGKFKRSSSGMIVRQEGNSYKSSRIRWITSHKSARLKLSRKLIKLWRAIEPVFREGFSEPSLQEIPSELLCKEKLQTTYVRKKKDLNGLNYFGLMFSGIIIPTTNRKYWKQFEPLARYDKASGNKILPFQKSFGVVDENVSRVERDYQLPSTNVFGFPVPNSELSSSFR